MEVKRFHTLRDMPLKWSFALYVTVCVLTAILLSFSFANLFWKLQGNIHDYYNNLYQDELAKQAYIMSSDGEILQNGSVWVYSYPLTDKFTERDLFLYDLYGTLAIISVPVVSAVCILAAGALFYLRKLKKPLAVLDTASSRIAAGDLDFTVETDSRNELGRLTASFEIMRKSLYETNREMWRMMEGRRRLNAAFAHDLRTPLTVLRGYSDFLLKYYPEGKIDGEKAVSTLTTMDVYLKRLEGYTETMASLQKLDEIELTPVETDFNSLCSEMENISGILAADKKLIFRRGGACTLYADAHAILQVLENLVSNAVRYALNTVEVTCETGGGVLNISVFDDGPGFSPEALKNAAEPYYRDTKETSPDTPGAAHFGIGLYISRLLCEKHGGSLTIENSGGGKVTARFASSQN